MKTYYVWKKINGKKVDILKLKSELTKEEVIKKLGAFKYDGIDVVRTFK